MIRPRFLRISWQYILFRRALQVNPGLDYLDRLQFGIYGVADAGVFMFGKADGQGALRHGKCYLVPPDGGSTCRRSAVI